MLLGGTELIYLDVPFDTGSPQYQLAAEYLETPDGEPRDPRVRFLCLPLGKAILVKAHPQNLDLDSGPVSGGPHA